jgi:hypothetical protein
MLRTAKRLQSRAINYHNFPGIPPLVWIVDKSSTNGVLSNVIPFVSVAFIVAENMIKKAALPDRRGPCQRNMFCESLFQHSYPWPKLKIVGSADEKMNMIGHHHISANGDFVNRVRLLDEPDECRVHRIGREQFPPLVCTKCDEEQGIVSEDPPQERRKFWIFAHANLVAASLWEAQCRCSLVAPASPAERRLQGPEVPMANRSFLERNTRPRFSGRIVVERKELLFVAIARI